MSPDRPSAPPISARRRYRFVELTGIDILIDMAVRLKRRYRYRSRGYDFGWLVDRIAELFHIDRDKVTRPGRYPETVVARSVLFYWAARELGASTLELPKGLEISQPTTSQSVKQGERLVADKKLKFMA